MRLARVLRLQALLLLFATPAATQVLRGRVLDAADARPVPQARISVVTADGRVVARAATGAAGTFSIALRVTEPVRLRAERTGYAPTLTQPVQVGLHETLDVDVQMAVEPLRIEPLTVVGRIQPPRRRSLEVSGFYNREARGIGRFLRREEIERHSNMDLAQVLDRIPGTTRIGPVVVFDRSSTTGVISRTQKGQGTHCPPQVYLDGSRMVYDQRAGINGVIEPEHLEAVEVFQGPSQIPAEYNGSEAACGVILLWSRKEP
jgi:hypothetical protein